MYVSDPFNWPPPPPQSKIIYQYGKIKLSQSMNVGYQNSIILLICIGL